MEANVKNFLAKEILIPGLLINVYLWFLLLKFCLMLSFSLNYDMRGYDNDIVTNCYNK